MQLSVNIQPTVIDTINTDLYIEVNGQGLSYIILENNQCIALVIYRFESNISDETAANHIHQVIADQPVLQQKFNRTHIIYGYAQSVLVPQQFMQHQEAEAMLELVYGEVSERVTRTDFVAGQAIYNVYGLPFVIDMVITRYFNFADFHHLFSLLPGVLKELGEHLYCIFGNGQLKLMLLKNDRLQVMQTYWFKVPEDVAYHLLNVCTSFDVDSSILILHISGMIDENSALYNVLHKYFLQLKFEQLPERYQYPESILENPPHYFSHLFAITACV